MFNLLPEKDKENILKEYSTRRTIILFMFVSTLGLIASTAFLPAYIVSRAEVAETENQIKQIKESPLFAESEKMHTALAQANTKISILSKENGVMQISEVIALAVKGNGQAIRVTGFSFQKNKGKSKLMITGMARDRESLSNFVKELEKEKRFETVNLPVSNFTKDRNAEFSIDIQGTF
jgi:Tfp pilus assembly protein PilN